MKDEDEAMAAERAHLEREQARDLDERVREAEVDERLRIDEPGAGGVAG